MSEENVESFKRGTEAYNRRDLDELLKTLDPEVEWHSALLIPFGGAATVSRGHDGVRELLDEVYEALAEIHLDYSEIRDLGDRIVGIGRIRTRGKHSGAVIPATGSVARSARRRSRGEVQEFRPDASQPTSRADPRRLRAERPRDWARR